jgi:hypothetical protein
MNLAGQAANWLGNKILGDTGQTNAKEMMDYQAELNKEAADHTATLQRNMFDYTYSKQTPEAMRANYEAAGMNPALIYGQGANNVGGTTTGSASEQGVQQGHYNTAAEMMQARAQQQQVMLQTQLQEAQIKNINADTEKKQSETNNNNTIVKDLANANIQNIIADTNNKYIQNTGLELDNNLKELDRQLKNSTLNINIETAEQTLAQMKEQTIQLMLSNDITKESKESLIQLNHLAVKESISRICMQDAKANLDKTQADAVADYITIGYMNARANGMSAQAAVDSVKNQLIMNDNNNRTAKEIATQNNKTSITNTNANNRTAKQIATQNNKTSIRNTDATNRTSSDNTAMTNATNLGVATLNSVTRLAPMLMMMP